MVPSTSNTLIGILYASREYVFVIGLVGHLNVLFGCIMPTLRSNSDVVTLENAKLLQTEAKGKLELSCIMAYLFYCRWCE